MIGGWIAAGLARLGLRPFPDLARGALRPGESTAAQVRYLLGEPDAVHEAEGGVRVHEYPRGPAGAETWMVEIGPDDRYRGMRNVLVDACFRQIEPGDHIEDVRRRLGRPGASADFPRRGERVLSWKYRADGGRLEHFNAHFDASGRLTGVSRTPDPESINAQ
ncbi:MAG: hypothetical protein WCZ28_04985 [Burkholderiaceae bacterium]